MVDLVDIENGFESSLSLLDGAREALDTFEKQFKKEFSAIGLDAIKDSDSFPGYDVFKFSTDQTPSITLRRRAYNVLNECRNALDQAVTAASWLFGVPKNKTNIYFPFATDAADFDRLYAGKGRCRHTAPILIPELKRFKPWWGADDVLRTLGKLSGPNKHQVIIDFSPEIRNYHGGPTHFPKQSSIFLPPTRPEFIKEMPFGLDLKAGRGKVEFILAVAETHPDNHTAFNAAAGALCATEANRLQDNAIDLILPIFVGKTSGIVQRIKSFVIEEIVP